MNIKEMIPLILQVLTDFRVIVTVVAMILVIKFAKFISSYRKKARKRSGSKTKKVNAPVQKESPQNTQEAAE